MIVPASAAVMKLNAPEFYFDLAQVFRRGETVDVDKIVGHLNTVGYTKTDVVEMPGEYALRGGILDVYPPEADRPLRVEFFGDEVESIRKFDPGTQRSSTDVDEVSLQPLTDTPVREDTLAAINARLSAGRIAGSEHDREDAILATGVAVFPGWELYAPVAGAGVSIFDLLPNAGILINEPSSVKAELEHWWERVENAHERSGVGNLVRPDDLYFVPRDWWNRLGDLPAADLEQLGITEFGMEEVNFSSQPTTRFHGSIPAIMEEVKKLSAENQRVMIAAGSTGEVERLAEVFSEYGVTFRLGSRSPRPGETFIDDAAYLSGEEVSTTIVKAFIPDGIVLPEARLVIFGACDLFDESDVTAVRPQRSKSKTSAFVSDFRDLAVGDYVVHVEHGIGQYQGLKEIPQQDGSNAEFMILEYAEGARLYVPLTRLDLVQKFRSAEGARPLLSRLGTQQWQKTKARVKKAMRDMAEELLKLYAARKPVPGHAYPADSHWQQEFEDAFEYDETDDQTDRHHRHQARHGSRHADGPPAVRRRRLRQDRSRDARGVQGGERQAGRVARADDGARVPALETFKERFAAFPSASRWSAASATRRSRRKSSRRSRPARSTSSSARTGCCRRTSSSATSACSSSTRSSASASRTKSGSSRCAKKWTC